MRARVATWRPARDPDLRVKASQESSGLTKTVCVKVYLKLIFKEKPPDLFHKQLKRTALVRRRFGRFGVHSSGLTEVV